MFKRHNGNIFLTNEKGDACYINLRSSFSLSPMDERVCVLSFISYILNMKNIKKKKRGPIHYFAACDK